MENKDVLSNTRPKLWTSWKSRIVLFLVAPLIWSTAVKGLQVIGGNVTVMQGETAILPCKLINGKEKVTQIAWRKKRQPDNFYTILPNSGPQFVDERDERFKFIGNFDDKNGSLQLSNVSLRDHGTYTCIFTLFPSGNIKTEIPLNLLVPPFISVKDNYPMLGDEEVCLISCIAAASKPPAEVKWVTDTLAEKVRATTNSTQHPNGTTTTVGSLFGVPTREINEHRGQCVVNGASMSEEESLPFTIHVYFSPTEINVNKTSEHSIECVTDANPKADFTWSRSNQSWPESSVRVEGGTLHFLSMTSHLNGLYQCEASNLYGKKHSHIYVYVSSDCRVCWTLYVLLLVLIALVVVAMWFMVRSGRFPRTDMVTRGEMTQVQTACSTPEENQCEAEELQTEGRPV